MLGGIRSCLVVGVRMVTPQFSRVLACVLSAQNPDQAPDIGDSALLLRGIRGCPKDLLAVALLAGTCFANRPGKA